MYRDSMILAVLVLLNIFYVYLLHRHVITDFRHLHFVIKEDSMNTFKSFMNNLQVNVQSKKWNDDKWKSDYRKNQYNDKPSYAKLKENTQRRDDDFFLDKDNSYGFTSYPHEIEIIVPSPERICKFGNFSILSQYNYKYMWMLNYGNNGNDLAMESTATYDTPHHLRAFESIPVNNTCASGNEGGWVLIKAPHSTKYIHMIDPRRYNDTSEGWLIKTGTANFDDANKDEAYWFLMEKEGYLLNKGAMAFVNNIASGTSFSVRGHTEEGRKSKPAFREYGASVKFKYIDRESIEASVAEEAKELKDIGEEDARNILTIQNLPLSKEVRVISFGLYGTDKKYTDGAIRNAELRDTYFPGWICRYYVTSDVPQEVTDKLESLGAEIRKIPLGEGYTAGMFYRFSVAYDLKVDRFIVRDSDSRLNARDRLAVEEWITSGASVHAIRDHVNHCSYPMNGGMWGAVKGALPHLKTDLDAWKNKNVYSADLDFLAEKVWPDIKASHFAHDSYCCDRFPNTHPFPSKRPMNYQHVGQVFDAMNRPRQSDIDGFIRGVPIPSRCRMHSDWIYG